MAQTRLIGDSMDPKEAKAKLTDPWASDSI